jgi:SH3-like domain-containing protein
MRRNSERWGRWLSAVCAGLLLAMAAPAGADGFKPYYVSLDRDKVFLREGPTYQHRVLWTYQRKGLPLRVIAQYDVWRRVKDKDGSVGWILDSMLSRARVAVVAGSTQAPVHASDAPSSDVVALAQPGVLAKLKSCEPTICKVDIGRVRGWIEKKNIWGVDEGETF